MVGLWETVKKTTVLMLQPQGKCMVKRNEDVPLSGILVCDPTARPIKGPIMIKRVFAHNSASYNRLGHFSAA